MGASWVNQDMSVHVLQDVVHNEPVTQIDEEVAHLAVQLESDEAWAQQVEQRIVEGELPNENAGGQDVEMLIETETSETGSALEAWGVRGRARPSDFGEQVHIVGFTRSGAALKRAL